MSSFLAHGDPATLLTAMVLIFSVACFSWGAMAHSKVVPTKVSLCMATVNILMAASLLTLALRGVVPDLLSEWGSDVFSICAMAVLRATIPVLANKRLAWRSGAVISAGASALLASRPYAGGGMHWHAVVVFAALATLTLLAAVDAWRELRTEVKRGMAALLSGPLFMVCLLLSYRLVQIVINAEGPANLLDTQRSNVLFLWLGLLMNLLLNGTIALLVLLQLILHIQRLTRLDPLTQALNRRALQEAIRIEHTRLRRGKPYAVLMIDMDNFKHLNDTLGHAAGDAALKRLVEILGDSVRDVDHLGRCGGEEFCVVLPLTDLAGATLVAERMRYTLENAEFIWQGRPWPLTASFGVAEALPSDTSEESVLIRADQGLFKAKSQGRNVVQARES
ncbi:GGDEF domain-containing protein [Roseateles koreensis]|uniref:diguanylate cyclase n=1 Tax=Roseateles koreensis TaxID=2987526 RepID=A0ABT5KPN4_9BURK|nr:GGDEF domain-containing protein [Roseateles koreensis]MDC8784816.1 GGDEF domain-containing protein [Roseateles koreensis]